MPLTIQLPDWVAQLQGTAAPNTNPRSMTLHPKGLVSATGYNLPVPASAVRRMQMVYDTSVTCSGLCLAHDTVKMALTLGSPSSKRDEQSSAGVLHRPGWGAPTWDIISCQNACNIHVAPHVRCGLRVDWFVLPFSGIH